MVPRNTVESSDTIPNSFVEGGRTGKYVMHTWYSVSVMRRGKAGVGDVVFRVVLKEGVLYSQFVGSENLEEIFTARITSWVAMWSKSFLVFFAVSGANPCIDVATQDDLSGVANGTYHGVKECTELIMALVITGEVG
jgi:hypothetical protein